MSNAIRGRSWASMGIGVVYVENVTDTWRFAITYDSQEQPRIATGIHGHPWARSSLVGVQYGLASLYVMFGFALRRCRWNATTLKHQVTTLD